MTKKKKRIVLDWGYLVGWGGGYATRTEREIVFFSAWTEYDATKGRKGKLVFEYTEE